jgi:hypothetical protein
LQGDVAGVGPAFEAVNDVGDAGAAFGEVGGDLRDVAESYDLGAGAGAHDDDSQVKI